MTQESRQMRRHRERMEAKGHKVSYESKPEQREQMTPKRKGKVPFAAIVATVLGTPQK